ncbi:MAG: hypothetical protein F6K19_01800, partial [Cyanothece sp. SIO1E1]|nr:hypothetical protein [Cyanothece sp. SIO1E1]
MVEVVYRIELEEEQFGLLSLYINNLKEAGRISSYEVVETVKQDPKRPLSKQAQTFKNKSRYDYPFDFLEFAGEWMKYSVRKDERMVAAYKTYWKKLKISEKRDAYKAVKTYFKSVEDRSFACIARTYLKDKIYYEELMPFKEDKGIKAPATNNFKPKW